MEDSNQGVRQGYQSMNDWKKENHPGLNFRQTGLDLQVCEWRSRNSRATAHPLHILLLRP